MTDIVAVERAVTQYLAEKLGLMVDREIFRGEIPPGIDGCAVAVWGLEVSNLPGSKRLKMYFTCHFPDRDKVHQMMADVIRWFPIYDLRVKLPTGDELIIRALLPGVSFSGNRESDNGQINVFGEIGFKIIL